MPRTARLRLLPHPVSSRRLCGNSSVDTCGEVVRPYRVAFRSWRTLGALNATRCCHAASPASDEVDYLRRRTLGHRTRNPSAFLFHPAQTDTGRPCCARLTPGEL